MKYRVCEYNLAPPSKTRTSLQVSSEIHALLYDEDVDWLGLTEAIGHNLPHIPGYRLIRSRRTDGRANVAAYVRKRKGVRVYGRWADQRKTWPRTEHPGAHPARSILKVRMVGVGTWQRFLVAHAPADVPGAGPARDEHSATIKRILSRAIRAVTVLVMDSNDRATGTHGNRTVATQTNGTPVGDRIDCGIVRNATVTDVRYITHTATTVLKSDHRHALIFDITTK